MSEGSIDISYLQDETATPPCPFIKKAGSPAMYYMSINYVCMSKGIKQDPTPPKKSEWRISLKI
jgi:hypothetical protein